jgi:hypothetical protein
MQLVQTEIIDVIDKRGNIVASLDGSDVSKAARQFAAAWRGGLIQRIHDNQGPTMTKPELQALSSRAWKSQDGVSFQRRYLNGTQPCYPEGDRTLGVPRTALAGRAEDAINIFAHRAWSRGLERIEAETAKLEAEIGTTDAARYAEGLEEISKLDAKAELKRRIQAMDDPVAKRRMITKYPELFSHDEMSRLAQERSHAKHAGK